MLHADEQQALADLLRTSRTLYAARVGASGAIEDANDALRLAAGRDLIGEPATVLAAEPQRPALAAHLAAAGPAWSTLTVGCWFGGPGAAEDRAVHVRRDGDAVVLVAEPDSVQRDELIEQVLRLNDDLIDSQRALGRRQREVDRAQAGALEAERRLRRLEAVVLAGFTSQSLDIALDRLLVLARDALGAQRAAVLLVDEPRRTLRVRAALDMDILGEVTPFGTGVSGSIAAAGRGMVFDDIAAAEGLAAEHRRFRGSLAGVPLRLEGEVIGVLHVSTTEVGHFGPQDLRLLEAVGARAALAIGHAQLREREQRIAETLQRSLLPQALPQAPGLSLCARYLPRGAEGGQVGGDFYDAVALPGGRLGLAIGDMAGKGLAAAAAMGQVRAALHAYALEDGAPGSVLDRLDRFVTAMDAMATATLVIVDGEGALAIASAGHPPAVLADAAGAHLLYGEVAPPLGTGVSGRGEQHARLPEDGRLLLYTDGLIERRGEGIDTGLEALRSVVSSAPPGLDALCDRVLAALAPDPGWPDDVALLAVRRSGRTGPPGPAFA
ncbi:SpoIIE family protein phosphatase [Baekduia soli]|uniref:SpoIIE family protein phosphatase n=1 Tax=Baekduia soli TaxID=496014 RepID=A0A5B8UAM7_9ACTN|nr:GAF domain-containing SpoIIE family protein phosphatase [Baekduia soli]QEC50034.1 SpoIIE family protein phosphatase [Baekduia soli]